MGFIKEEEKGAVKVLMEDNPGHTKDIKKKLTLRLTSPRTVLFLVVLNVSMMVAIIILAVQVSLVRNADEPETKNQIYAPCEDHWIWYRGQCYYFSEERDTWNNSQKFCISHNASLVHIDNKQELDFLNRYKGSDNHWIGLRRTDDNKDWIWTNGTLYNESLFEIVRLSNITTEYVYLNHKDVQSQQWEFKTKWICKKT